MAEDEDSLNKRKSKTTIEDVLALHNKHAFKKQDISGGIKKLDLYFKDNENLDLAEAFEAIGKSKELAGSLMKICLNGYSIDDFSFLEGFGLTNLSLNGCKIGSYDSLKENMTLRESLKLLSINEMHIPDFSFLSGYSLENVHITSCTIGSFYSLKYNDTLKRSLHRLTFQFCDDLTDISFLNGYSISDLTLNACPQIINFDAGLRNNEQLKNSLYSLNIRLNNNLDSCEFLQGYSLRELVLDELENLKDIGPGLKNNYSLKKMLRRLSVQNHKGELRENDLSYLTAYDLEHLTLNRIIDKSDFGFLRDNASLEENLSVLDLADTNFKSLHFLKRYKAIRTLRANNSEITDISDFLNYEFVRNHSLKELEMPAHFEEQGNPGRYILGELGDSRDPNFPFQEPLDLHGSKDEQIEQIENNHYDNPHYVKVDFGEFDHATDRLSLIKPDPLIYELLTMLDLDDSQLEDSIIIELDKTLKSFADERLSGRIYAENSMGRVAKKVARIHDKVFKITSTDDYLREHSVYTQDMHGFNRFRPMLLIRDKIYNSEIGILALENLEQKESMFHQTLADRNLSLHDLRMLDSHSQKIMESLARKSGVILTKDRQDKTVLLGDYVASEGAIDVYDYLDHYMYALSQFHENAPDTLRLLTPRHKDLSGRDYIQAIDENMGRSNLSGILAEFDFDAAMFKGVLDEVSKAIETNAIHPIIGDFKRNNTIRGNIIDFDRIRLGHPIEDIVRFLEQPDFGLDEREKAYFVNRYLAHRSKENPLIEEKKDEFFRLYPVVAFYENFRKIWAYNDYKNMLHDPVYRQQLISGIRGVKENAKRLLRDKIL